MATDPFSNFKATPFVSQYAGLPIEEFAKSAQVLQQRGIQNREQLDKLDMMAYQIQTAPIDESVKQSRIQAIRDEQERIAQSGAYEMSGDLVRGQVKDFTRDKRLQTAQGNYASYQKMLEDSANLSPAQQEKVIAAYKKYVSEGGVGEEADQFGRYNKMSSIQFYEDQDISKFVRDFSDGWMADQNAYASPDGKGYIVSGTNKFVPYAEVYNMAMQAVQADPKMRRQLNDEALYTLSRMQGDSGVMFTGNPMDTITVTDPATGQPMEISAQEYVAQQYVNPYAVKESYQQATKDVKGDASFGDRLTASKGNQLYTYSSAAQNYGNIPDTPQEFESELVSINTRIKDIDATLARTDIDEETRTSLSSEKDGLLTNKSRLDNIKSGYFDGLPKADSFAGQYAMALKEAGITSIPRGSTTQGREGTTQGKTAKELDPNYALAEQIYKDTYKKVYGTNSEAPGFGTMTTALSNGNQQVNKMLSSQDFAGALEKEAAAASSSAQMIMFPETIDKEKLTTALLSGQYEAYASGETGVQERLTADLSGIEGVVAQATSGSTPEGVLYDVKLPIYDDKIHGDLPRATRNFLKDYKGGTIKVKELGASNVQSIAEQGFDAAAKNLQAANLPGNAQQQQVYQNAFRQQDSPYTYATDIQNIESDPIDLYKNSQAIATVTPVKTQAGIMYRVTDNVHGVTYELVNSKEKATAYAEALFNNN